MEGFIVSWKAQKFPPLLLQSGGKSLGHDYFHSISKSLPSGKIVIKSLLPLKCFQCIMKAIVPAKAMHENVSSNWRVFYFGASA